MPFISFDTYKSFNAIIDNFNDRFENRRSKKEPSLSNKAFIKREIMRVKDGINQYKNIPLTYNILIAYLPWLEDKLEETTTEKKPVSSNKKTVLLEWNEDKHVLTNIFYQLKNETNKTGERLIPNTVREIAQFLKDNFKVFEDTNVTTIETQLTKADKQPKKTKVAIQITRR